MPVAVGMMASVVGKPVFDVPMRKVSFTCWPVLNIAGEEKIEMIFLGEGQQFNLITYLRQGHTAAK